MVVFATGRTRNQSHSLGFTELLAMGLVYDAGVSLFGFFPFSHCGNQVLPGYYYPVQQHSPNPCLVEVIVSTLSRK